MLLGRQPGVAAEQDQLPPSIGLGKMRFENGPVRGREVPKYFRNAAVLTRFGQLKRPIDCRCHPSGRYHEPPAETNVGFRPIADISSTRPTKVGLLVMIGTPEKRLAL